jgi:hypothetical protein
MVFSGRIVPAYDDRPEPAEKDKALADPALPPVLKDLAERIIPKRLLEDFRDLVTAGAIDPLDACVAQPLLCPVSQVMGLPPEEADAWLKVLFANNPAAVTEAKCPCYGFRHGRFSTDPDYRDSYYGTELETPSLLSVLAGRTETPVIDVAKIFPQGLSVPVPDRYGISAEWPLLHQLLNSKELSVETLDKLEELTGGDDFLSIKNGRGETLLHNIASNNGAAEDQIKLDAVSWMLQRRPDLINEPDRFGWTPLDRLVSRAQGKVDTSMGRLLIVSGAKLEKQIAPQFNLQSALDEHSGGRLDKPAPRKPGSLGKVL